MRKYGFYILLVLTILGTAFLPVDSAFSQTAQTETDGSSSYRKGITAGRARSLAGGVIGLASLVIGWSARRRWKKDYRKGRNLAIVALVLGLICIILSLVHLTNTAGAVFGSGSGKAGAIVALIPGLTGILLSWLVVRQTKQIR